MESHEAPWPPYAMSSEAYQWYRSGYAHGWNARQRAETDPTADPTRSEGER